MTRREKLLVAVAVTLASLGSAGIARAVITTPIIPPHQLVPKATIPPGSFVQAPGTPWNFQCPNLVPFSPAQQSNGQWTSVIITSFFVASLWDSSNREFFCGYSSWQGGSPQTVGMWDIESIDPRAQGCTVSANLQTLQCHW